MTRDKSRPLGYQEEELSHTDLANLVIAKIDELANLKCKSVSEEIREELKRLTQQLLTIKNLPVCCLQDWLNILKIEKPSELIKKAKRQLQNCMKEPGFQKCRVINILLNVKL